MIILHKLKFLLIFLIIIFSLGLYAEENDIEKQNIIISAADPWPPFVDPDNPSDGLSLEIIRSAFDAQGYTVVMEYVPWARAESGVIKGTYDILPDVWKTLERSENMLFSHPYAKNSVKFIKRKGHEFEYTDIDSLSGLRIGVIRGFGYSNEFLSSEKFTREPVSTFMQNIYKLLHKRIDLTLEDEIVAIHTIKQKEPNLLKNIEFVDKPLSINELHISAGYNNPRHEEIINAFNEGLKEIKASGKYSEIFKKYGFEPAFE